MATRSAILNLESGQMTYIHWDGYPDGVGKTLREHYATQDAVDALFKRAESSDMSTLEPTVEGCKWYDDRCRREGRNIEPLMFRHAPYSRDEAFASYGHAGCEYLYVWENGAWSHFPTRDSDAKTSPA